MSQKKKSSREPRLCDEATWQAWADGKQSDVARASVADRQYALPCGCCTKIVATPLTRHMCPVSSAAISAYQVIGTPSSGVSNVKPLNATNLGQAVDGSTNVSTSSQQSVARQRDGPPGLPSSCFATQPAACHFTKGFTAAFLSTVPAAAEVHV